MKLLNKNHLWKNFYRRLEILINDLNGLRLLKLTKQYEGLYLFFAGASLNKIKNYKENSISIKI